MPTLSTRDRFALIARAPDQVDDDEVDACTFRMLTPAEILAATSPSSGLSLTSRPST